MLDQQLAMPDAQHGHRIARHLIGDDIGIDDDQFPRSRNAPMPSPIGHEGQAFASREQGRRQFNGGEWVDLVQIGDMRLDILKRILGPFDFHLWTRIGCALARGQRLQPTADPLVRDDTALLDRFPCLLDGKPKQFGFLIVVLLYWRGCFFHGVMMREKEEIVEWIRPLEVLL